MPTGRFRQGTGPVAQPADLVIEEVHAIWPDEPIRIRLQPQVYLPTPNSNRNGMFKAWRGLYWNWQCTTLDDARLLRQVLTRTMALVATEGPVAVLERLTVDKAARLDVESAVDLQNAHTNTV